MEGKNVLFPIGWDAFGLPTENYAIKTGKAPQEITAANTETFRRQMQSLGLSFDWSREINTTDPAYYRWTQWMFLQFFKNGLAYKKKMPINWCPSCKIGLANEEAAGGKCERCGHEVEKRDKEQWMIAITKYADRLLEDLKTVDYLPKIKKQQEEWIGRSEGAIVKFQIPNSKSQTNSNSQISTPDLETLPSVEGMGGVIKVFTTRPDTLFGATYLVLAPEHPLVSEITTDEQRAEVEAYVAAAKSKSEIERGDETKEKTGVFTGAYAINPVNNEEIPIWAADYVLMSYGTGAIMAVPAHDERDWDFATRYQLKKISVVEPVSLEKDEYELVKKGERCYVGEGVSKNPDFLNGLPTWKAKDDMISWLEEEGLGARQTQYKLRDWIFSRQRYWGEPIPLVYCEKCGWVPVKEKDLPVLLPDMEHYEPTDTGESPLATITDWVDIKCPTCDGPAKRETDTMPNWAGSSWYFLRYIDPKNNKVFADPKKLQYWMPVDLYNGGMEHTTLHLLYSRFWNKFLFDQGFVPTSEPYARRHSHGLILGPDGVKMSKSRGNVINPDDIINEYGADTLRTYEAFVGPFEEAVPWNENGVVGARRFLERVNGLVELVVKEESKKVTRALHQTIKKVTEDIEDFRFNTAVAQMMTLVNVVYDEKGITKESFLKFVRLLCPFAPHLTNEIFSSLGGKGFVEAGEWPGFDPRLVKEDEVSIAVQVNGKLRGVVVVSSEAGEAEVRAVAEVEENVKKYLAGKEVVKAIFVKGKLLNLVAK
jgi:leucyl-tRNA synthetase